MNKLLPLLAIFCLQAAAQNSSDPKAVDFNKVKGIEAKDLRNGKTKVNVAGECQLKGTTYQPGEAGFDNCLNAAKTGAPNTTGRGEKDLKNNRKSR